MTDQPVTPDREALNVDRWVEAVLDATCPNPRFRDDFRSNATRIVYKLLPPLTDALDRARQQGRNEAAEAIEAASFAPPLTDGDYPRVDAWLRGASEGMRRAADLARGGPNRKDEE